jgi:ribonuclease P protein component
LARLGFIVPKRLARAASLRNAIKRQAREAFRLMAREIPPGDLVLRLTRVTGAVKAKDHSQLKVWRVEMEALLQRLPALAE